MAVLGPHSDQLVEKQTEFKNPQERSLRLSTPGGDQNPWTQQANC